MMRKVIFFGLRKQEMIYIGFCFNLLAKRLPRDNEKQDRKTEPGQ
jgi:hypothetical protein